MADRAGKKALKNHQKGEDIADAAAKTLTDSGIKAETTQNHNPRGDIRIPKGKGQDAGKILKDVVEQNRKKKN